MKIGEEGYYMIVHFIFITCLYVGGILFIIGKDCSFLSVLLGIILIFLELYWAHRVVHLITPDSIVHKINPHVPFHHAPVKTMSRTNELLLEVFGVDLPHVFYVISGQYIGHLITGVWFIPLTVILVSHITYSMAHLINYSLVGHRVHRAHHLNVGVNYGPDIMDHLFGTNSDSVIEDPIINLVPMLIGIGSTYLLKRWIG